MSNIKKLMSGSDGKQKPGLQIIYLQKEYDNLKTLILDSHSNPLLNFDMIIVNDDNEITVESIKPYKDEHIQSKSSGLDSNDELISYLFSPREFSTEQIDIVRIIHKKYIYGMIQTNDDIYHKSFCDKQHYIYVALKGNEFSIFIMAVFDDHYVRGCIISKTPTIEFCVPIIYSDTPVKFLNKLLPTLFPNYVNFRHIPYTDNHKFDILKFNNNFAFAESKMCIGLIYTKHNQTCEKFLENGQRDVSLDYKNFLRLMDIPDDFNEDYSFDDVFEDVKLSWYQSVSMSKSKIRKYIGNVSCVIIYRQIFTDQKYVPFDTSEIKHLGKVNQVFIIIEPFVDKSQLTNTIKYCIRVIYKNMEEFEPFVPKNHYFDERDLKDFILTKLYNSTIMLKEKSQVSNLFQYPRQIALNNLIQIDFNVNK